MEKDRKALHALREAVALIQLKDEKSEVQIAACKELAELGSIPNVSRESLKRLWARQATVHRENTAGSRLDLGWFLFRGERRLRSKQAQQRYLRE